MCGSCRVFCKGFVENRGEVVDFYSASSHLEPLFKSCGAVMALALFLRLALSLVGCGSGCPGLPAVRGLTVAL